MTNIKSTKRALLSSVLALFLCFAMLLGSTFAWFTDSVTSANNVIKSGNLDIELDYWDAVNSEWKTVEGTNSLFTNNLWEPGHTEVVYLKLSNLGSLALKYQLSIDVLNETEGTNKLGETFKLSDYIQMGVVDGKNGETNAYTKDAAGRAQAIAEAGKTGIIGNGYAKQGNMEQGAEDLYMAVVVYMPENVGNDANAMTGTAVPTIELGVKVLATQYTVESDSFDENYDKGAALPWDGKTVDTTWYDSTATEYVLYSAEEFAGLASIVSSGDNLSGKTVKLGTDIDLANMDWTPIGRMINTSGTGENSTFKGDFDGQNHTIYNLNVDTVDEISDTNMGAGLFGAITGNISNVNIVNATVKTNHWAGVIAGSIEGSIDNCSVENVTITCLPELIGTKWDNGDKAGAIAGYATSGTVSNCTVTNATITAYRDMGAIVGGSYNSVSASTVSNVTLIKDSTHDYKDTADDTTVNAYVGTVYGGATVEATGDVKIVKAVSTSDADTLASALKGTDKNISIVLTGDVDLPIASLGQQTSGSGEYKLGGEETETITIDLNGYRLNVTTGYWSVLGAKNDNAVFTIKDGTMTSSQPSGTWNSYDLAFANCNYVIENVTFEKAIALENAGKSATLKNVTINEKNGDYYAMWITAEGQNVTIDGLTVNSVGRGIKIDGEYVDPTMKVTLNVSNATFNTVNKAAILVDTPAGADITLSNVDISGVKADHVHEVWVDSDATDYTNNVTVTGGDKYNEADLVTDNEELDNALTNGKTDIQLAGGTYQMPDSAKGKTLTIRGGFGDTVIEVENESGKLWDNPSDGTGVDYSLSGSTVTFYNVTIDTTNNNGTYPSYARLTGNYNNCTFNGTYTLGTGDDKFNSCTFNVTGDRYNVWTWGGKSVEFTDCTFNCDGKALLVYNQTTNVTLTNCIFNDNGGLVDEKKAAIETGADNATGATYTINIKNITVNGFSTTEQKSTTFGGTSLGTNVWGNKNLIDADHLNVIIDGTEVY